MLEDDTFADGDDTFKRVQSTKETSDNCEQKVLTADELNY